MHRGMRGSRTPQLATASSSKDHLQRLWSDDSGQGLVEYILIIAVIAIGLTFIILTLRASVGGLDETVTAVLKDVPDGCRNPVPGAKNPNCS